ncbi:uncharacterized protein DAT39_001514, partial [Clarias magur]
MDVKVFDDLTEVDEETFGYLLTRPDLAVLEIVIPGTANIDAVEHEQLAIDMVYIEDFLSSSSLGDTEDIEDIIKSSPGGEKVLNEYSHTKGPSDARRRDMVKILVAYLRNEHGTSSSRRLKDEYAKGIISLFPCLADHRSKLGYV